jgi:hypothetical protein
MSNKQPVQEREVQDDVRAELMTLDLAEFTRVVTSSPNAAIRLSPHFDSHVAEAIVRNSQANFGTQLNEFWAAVGRHEHYLPLLRPLITALPFPADAPFLVEALRDGATHLARALLVDFLDQPAMAINPVNSTLLSLLL